MGEQSSLIASPGFALTATIGLYNYRGKQECFALPFCITSVSKNDIVHLLMHNVIFLFDWFQSGIY